MKSPAEKYFSCQCHHGGGADNPTVEQFRENTASLIQKQYVYRDLQMMNVQPHNDEILLSSHFQRRKTCCV